MAIKDFKNKIKAIGYPFGLAIIGSKVGSYLGHEIGTNEYQHVLYQNINEILNNPELKNEFNSNFDAMYDEEYNKLKSNYNEIVNQKNEILNNLNEINKELSNLDKNSDYYKELQKNKAELQSYLNNLNFKLQNTETYLNDFDQKRNYDYNKYWNDYKHKIENKVKNEFALKNDDYINRRTLQYKYLGELAGATGGVALYKYSKSKQPQMNQPQMNQPQMNQLQLNQPKMNQPKMNQPKMNLSESITISYKKLKGF